MNAKLKTLSYLLRCGLVAAAGRQVAVNVPVAGNPNVTSPAVLDLDAVSASLAGTIPSAAAGYVVATEKGDPSGIFHQTLLTITALPITMRDTQQGGGAKIYTFPRGLIARMGAAASIQVTVTSVLASTLHTGVTCNYGVGSTTQASATVATTEQDFVNVAAWTSPTTINVANAAAAASGPVVLALLDGRTTPIDAFLNLAVATGTDIGADATCLVSGTVRITWAHVGN